MCYNLCGMKTIAVNKKAYHNYFISDTFEAGIVLEGSEVKSVRAGGISINEAFIIIRDGEVFLKNAYIKEYDKASAYQPDEKRTRKLLLKKVEISKLLKKTEREGFTIVPLKVYFSGNLVKIEGGVGKGKKLYDKKEDLKERAVKKEIQKLAKKF